MISVSSSAVAEVGYEAGVLAVRFHTSSTVYVHHGVPYELFARFLNAWSKGAFYNAFIRGKFK